MRTDPLILKFALFLEDNRGRSAATSDSYLGYLKRLDEFLFSEYNSDVFACTRGPLEDFCGRWAHEQGLSIRSRRPLIAALRGFFGWLEEFNYRKDNPAKYLSYPRAGKPLPRLISRNNAERLLLHCDLSTFIGVRDAAILALLMATGMRISGLVKLNQEQFETHVTDDGQRIILLRVTEKGKKERIIPVDQVAELYLMMYLSHPDLLAIQDERLLHDGDHIMFVQVNRGNTPVYNWLGEGRRLGVRSIQRMIVRRGLLLGISRDELHPHALRHLFGTEMAEDDVSLERIQLLMGHESIQSTTIYLRTSLRRLAGHINESSPLAKMKTPLHAVRDQMGRHKRIEVD